MRHPPRYYNSRMGSFCSADPVEGDPNDPQTWNRYAYVRNNPINITDPSGKFFGLIAALLEVIMNWLSQTAPALATLGPGAVPPLIQTITVFGTVPTFATTEAVLGGGIVGGAVAASATQATASGQSPTQKQPSPNGKRDCNLITPAKATSLPIHYKVVSDAMGYFQPSMARQLASGIWQLNSEGIIPTITDGFRTTAMQLARKSVQISRHQQGLAADFGTNSNTFFSNLNVNSDINTAMTKQGLTWGGKFQDPDPVHYQQPPAGSHSPGQLDPNCPTPMGGGA